MCTSSASRLDSRAPAVTLTVMQQVYTLTVNPQCMRNTGTLASVFCCFVSRYHSGASVHRNELLYAQGKSARWPAVCRLRESSWAQAGCR
jgi:hypothetical protein